MAKRRKWTPPDVWHPAIVSAVNQDERTVAVVFATNAPFGEHQITRFELVYSSSILDDPHARLPRLGDAVKVNFVREDWKPA